MNSDHLSQHSLSRPPVTAMVSIWIPIIAISVWIVIVVVVVVLIVGWIPDAAWIVVIGIAVWLIGFSLIAVIGKRIVPPAPYAARIIIGRVSTTKNPTRRKPDLFFIVIRLCQANWCYQQHSWQ